MDQDKLRDLIYRHQLGAYAVGNQISDDIVRLLNRNDEDLLDQVTKRYARIEADGFDKGPETTKRIEAIKAMFAAVNKESYQAVRDRLVEELTGVGKTEAEFAAGAVKAVGGTVDMGTAIPPTAVLKTLVTTTMLPFSRDGVTRLMPWLDTQEAGRLRALEGALQLGILQGQTTGQLVQRIRGTKAKNYTDGVLNASRTGAQTIARTATAGVQNAARLETYKRMRTIKCVEWSSVLDSRTSDPCQSLSGKIWPIDEVPYSPPIHPNCRSTLIPRRDNEGAKHQPFPDWLRDQPDGVQDEVLGKTRGDIFRDNPKMNYDAFFKEVGGRRRTLEELRQFDASLFGEKAAPAPKGPGLRPDPDPVRFTSPIDLDVSAATIEVIKKRDAVKSLNARMAAGAADPRYDPRAEFRDVNAKDFGKAVLSADFTDETASMIAALMPELDKLTDAFGVPRLRAIKSASGGTVMGSMGDGVLKLNPTYFNGFAAEVGGASGGKLAAKVVAERDALGMELQAEKAAIDELKAAMRDLTGKEKDDMILRYLDLADAFNAKRQQWLKLDKKVLAARRTDAAADRPVSTWKPGDEVAKRPFNAIDYFERPLDRARMVLYHELSHHVHQMRGKQGRRAQFGTPPVEKALSAMFRDLKNYDSLPSGYSKTNGHEWWAESFGLYFMGRKDLVDPQIAKLIERLLDEVANGD